MCETSQLVNNYSFVDGRLTKFKRALDNLKKAKSELEEVYKCSPYEKTV